MAFVFSKENQQVIDAILKKYPSNQQQSAVLPLLDLAQRQNKGFLSKQAIDAVAKILNISPMHVQEVSTFYTMFNLKPIGKYHIQVCGTTPCMLCGAEDILNICKQELGVDANQTTADGMFTLKEVECLGACVNAPVMQINDDTFEDLSPKYVIKILNALKAGKKPQIVSQVGKKNSKAIPC